MPVLSAEIKQRLKEILAQVCDSKNISILGGNIGTSYVYMIVQCPPRFSPSDLMQFFKGRSSRILRQDFSAIKDAVKGDYLWESAYLCLSFGEANEEAINKYIHE